MGTLRLDDGERQNIINSFARILMRASNNKPFPMEKEEVWDFGLSLLEPKTVECYLYLRENNEKLVKSQNWHPTIELQDEFYSYHVTFCDEGLPQNGLQVPHTHPKYAEIHDWVTHYCDMEEQIAKARKAVRRVIQVCSSAGQIKRVLQPEILRFIPSHVLDTLDDAERQSRIPRNLELHDGDLELIANTLAVGSLSPEDRAGIDVEANRDRRTEN
jgi:hypothetical protein